MGLGEKVKALRQQSGLSQQQLAGAEMSRAFISLIESGKSMPSAETLRIIAQRLGKPVEYFLQDDAECDRLETLMVLLESVEKDLQTTDHDRLNAAQRKLENARSLAAGMDHPRIEAQIHLGLARCQRRRAQYEESLDSCERALEYFRLVGDAHGLAMSYREIGDISYTMDDYPAARKAYEKSLLYVNGLKTMQLFRVRVLTMLGATLLRLGEYEGASQRYQEAVDDCALLECREPLGDACLGLGCVLFKSGDLEGARKWMLKAATTLKEANSSDYIEAQHNLAIIEMARGNREAGYVILRECMLTYQAWGRSDRQAAVLEELAEYWTQKGDYAKAESLCWESLDLLELKDHGVLRGRLYRQLGKLAAYNGNLPYARNLFRVSLQLLRRLKANREAEETLRELNLLPQDQACQHPPQTV